MPADIFVVKITSGQEEIIARMLETKATGKKLDIQSILVLDEMKGYIFIESTKASSIDALTAGVKHARARLPQPIDIKEIEHFLKVKPVIEELEVDDVVEIVGGPLKGSSARVTRVDMVKEEVVVELLEATFALSITIPASYVKIVEKAKKETEKIV